MWSFSLISNQLIPAGIRPGFKPTTFQSHGKPSSSEPPDWLQQNYNLPFTFWNSSNFFWRTSTCSRSFPNSSEVTNVSLSLIQNITSSHSRINWINCRACCSFRPVLRSIMRIGIEKGQLCYKKSLDWISILK